MVYSDPSDDDRKEIAPKYVSGKPFIDAVDDKGVQNLVYLIDEEDDIKNSTIIIR